MQNKQFEKFMRSCQSFDGLRVPTGSWFVVRLEGRKFQQLSDKNSVLSQSIHEATNDTTAALMKELKPLIALTHSDEISLLFSPSWDLYNRNLETILSLTTSLASAAFAKSFSAEDKQHVYLFQGTTVVLASTGLVIDYFRWRQSEAIRNSIKDLVTNCLVKSDTTSQEIAKYLEVTSFSNKIELLEAHNIDVNKIPGWQRHGTMFGWRNSAKLGFNPITEKATATTRKELIYSDKLPEKEAFGSMLKDALISELVTASS